MTRPGTRSDGIYRRRLADGLPGQRDDHAADEVPGYVRELLGRAGCTPPMPGAKTLELGCGTGRLSWELAACEGRDYLGLAPSMRGQIRTVEEAWAVKRAHEEPDPVPHVASPGSDEGKPLYRRLYRLSVDDPGLLERAASIDRATADVLGDASEHLQVGNSRRRRSPADIAAVDDPRTPDAPARSAASAREPAPSDQTTANPAVKRPAPGPRRRA
jgi:hypothetical protein